MRVMVLVRASKELEAGQMPSETLLTDMANFNEQLMNAGIVLAGEGLQPSSKGKRVRFTATNRIVTGGPFEETKDLVAGYWLWQVNSIDEAVQWIKRAPFEAATRSRFAPCSRPTTLARSSRPSCGRRRSASAPGSDSRCSRAERLCPRRSSVFSSLGRRPSSWLLCP